LDLNARFLESDRAPEYVIFMFSTTDDRLPNAEDGEALKVLARDWRPVTVEGGYLLLRRKPGSPGKPLAPRVEIEREIGFDEMVDLPRSDSRCRLLALDVR